MAKLAKPSVAAWIVNRVSHDRPDLVDDLLDAGARLREVQLGAGSAADLRAAAEDQDGGPAGRHARGREGRRRARARGGRDARPGARDACTPPHSTPIWPNRCDGASWCASSGRSDSRRASPSLPSAGAQPRRSAARPGPCPSRRSRRPAQGNRTRLPRSALERAEAAAQAAQEGLSSAEADRNAHSGRSNATRGARRRPPDRRRLSHYASTRAPHGGARREGPHRGHEGWQRRMRPRSSPCAPVSSRP